ncbi:MULTISPECIES: HGxxPAAW family protein [unclassified Streptosporangium]|uniref:HGxxPAAW family protein n=1 Tax=unclassified Streptosporangium TaxID=2632669 RepID=UPI002E2909E8|nr:MULTISPECIES: HGxxPAAW family protein [unclassified Streptosporangium]
MAEDAGRAGGGSHEGQGGDGGPAVHRGPGGHGGRASSWLAVTVILLGFTIAGVALCLGPNWFVFWMGTAVCVMGAILTLVFRVFQDIVVEAPRAMGGETARGVLN